MVDRRTKSNDDPSKVFAKVSLVFTLLTWVQGLAARYWSLDPIWHFLNLEGWTLGLWGLWGRG